MTILSPRGYFLKRDDPKTSADGLSLCASAWFDEVGSDLCHAFDIRGQVKANWSARRNGDARSAGDNEFGANNEGLTHAWRAETIGPFPLHRLVTGQPQPVRVVVDLKSSDGEEVFVRGILRHMRHEVPAHELLGTSDGWDHGFATTDGTSYAALPLESQYFEATYPTHGLLQFPKALWHVDSAIKGGSLSKCVMACVDLYLGRMSDTTTVTLGGYTVYAVSHGARSTSSPGA